MVSRYADHLPLYRQAGMLARQGILVDRATLAGWVGTAAAEVAPVVRRMKAMLLASARLFADETSVPVLDPGRGRTKTGWFWTIARDDRPWGGADPPAVIYTYAPGRGREHARALLGGYRGILQCDGYGPYKALAGPATGPGPAVVAFCWSHARRQFYDLARTAKAPLAEEALRRIGALYAIEAEIRGASPERRLAERQSRSRPLVEELFVWLEATLPRLPARGTMAEAIRYALRHREGLLRFLDDGRIELDTNSVERAARPVALGRKNALFAGCDEGAEGGGSLGRHRLADRDVQAQRCRSPAVPHRPPHPPRRGMAAKPHRRAHAVVLVKSRSGLSRSGPSNPNPSKGHSTTLTHMSMVLGMIERLCAVHGRVFETLEDLRDAVRAFIAHYNAQWLIEKTATSAHTHDAANTSLRPCPWPRNSTECPRNRVRFRGWGSEGDGAGVHELMAGHSVVLEAVPLLEAVRLCLGPLLVGCRVCRLYVTPFSIFPTALSTKLDNR